MNKDLKVPSSSGGKDSEVFFANFFQGWLVRQHHYLDELLSASLSCYESSDDDLRQLVSRILAHYQQYYEEKSKITERNVFLVFFPPWFSSFELAFLWIAGFKPGLAFRLIDSSIDDLSENQLLSFDRLKKETKSKERSLDDELARIQERLGAPQLLEIAKRSGRRTIHAEQASDSDFAIASLKSSMEAVGTAADTLRMSTALKVMDVLEPAQGVKFLAAAAKLQLRLRSLGLEKRAVGDDET